MDLFQQAASDNALTVSALTDRIRKRLESDFREVWVSGEVSNLRHQSSGHLYFSLKDADSQLSCVLFRGDANRQPILPENGMECVLCGSISVYPPRGSYQLVVRVVVESGAGRLQAEFERLKRLLAAEGIFATEKKRAMPPLPVRIAVVTSATGAALQDFLRILKRRQFAGLVTVYPARVQGAGAAEEMCAALAEAMRGEHDVIVLTRGGGSVEDLWAFNNPDLVRAVAASTLPVISAVGHEIDHVLTDYAADIRAETPSGAAELISSHYRDILERVAQAGKSLERAKEARITSAQAQLKYCASQLKIAEPRYRLQNAAMRVDDLEQGLARSVEGAFGSQRQRLDECKWMLQQLNPAKRIPQCRQLLGERAQRLNRTIFRSLAECSKQVDLVESRMASSSVEATLRRGYAVLTDNKGVLLADTQGVLSAPEKKIQARLQDGAVRLRVDDETT